ncbi:MAG: aminoacyl-tRNA hydrolase, partial [Pseudomonadota bacterium]
MQLFVGLGNPGAQYAGHRHNIGFMALDAIASREGAAGWRAKFQGEIAEIRIGSGKILLLKPGTFMNLSGQAVGEAARFYDIAPEDVREFAVELVLAPG